MPCQKCARSPARGDLVALALFIALLFIGFRDFLITDRVFFQRDTTLVEIPVKKLTVQLLKEGHFALWTDAHGNGQPFLANPKNAIFYPTTWLYLVLPFFVAFKAHYLVHIIFGWIGLYVLCGAYGLSKRAAFLGATLFGSSGMYLSSFEFYNHIAALAWMPWILWLLHRPRGPGPARWVQLTLAWALMILAGAPEFVLMTILLAAGQGFFQAGPWRRKLATAAIPLVLAGSITAVQLLPSLELLGRTNRTPQAAQWPLAIVQLLDLPFPHFFGNGREPGPGGFWGSHFFDQQAPLYDGLYMGAGALFLAFCGLGKDLEKRRKILWLMAFLFFLLACGRFSPLFFLYRITPLLGSIRYPVKFFMGSVFCLSILAAHGADALAGSRPSGRKRASLFAGVTVAALLLFHLFQRPLIAMLGRAFVIDNEASLPLLGASIRSGLMALGLFGLAGLLLARSSGRGKALIGAMIAFAVLDPAIHNRDLNPTVPASFFGPLRTPGSLPVPLTLFRDEAMVPSAAERPMDNRQTHRFYRASLYPLTGIGDGVRYVFNWDFYGTYSRRDLELYGAVRKLSPDGLNKVLRYVGCSASLGRQPLFSKNAARPLLIEGRVVWLEPIADRQASPFTAFRAVRAVTVSDKLQAFTAAAFDPFSTVIVDKDLPLPAQESGPARPAAVKVLARAQGHEEYDASLPTAGVVVLPGHAAPGWRARIDGRPSEVFEANLFSKGVLVPAGRHRIVLRYLPASFVGGAAVSLISLALGLAGLAARSIGIRRRARRA